MMDSTMSTPKKRRVLAACQRCKQRKKRCDGKLPSCSDCTKAHQECVYTEANLQVYQAQMVSQISRLNQLEEQLLGFSNELSQLRSTIVHENVNEARIKEEIEQKNDFLNPILHLIKQPSTEALYIGPSAVISRVNAIRKMLTNDRDISNNSVPIKFKQIETVEETQPTKEVENLFVECYLTFSRNRYHFAEKSDIIKIFDKKPYERDHWESFIALICLGNGCRIAELSKLTTRPSPKFYFDRAFESLNQLPVLKPMQQIQVCMLFALYLHYSYDYLNPFVMNVWELSGLSIRKMVQLGYHKRRTTNLQNCKQVELEKRLFWSVYAFDRLLSISLGRPSSIADSEIDVAYPLSLESVDELTPELLLQFQNKQLANDPTFKLPVTSVTYLVETCRVRAIESRINIFAYNENKDSRDEFSGINQALEVWISGIPSRREFDEGVQKEVPYDYLLLLYHRAKLFLLLTKIASTQRGQNKDILHQILQAAAGICKAFKEIHRNSLFGYSTFSLHTIFLAGVTLVYCIWAMGKPPYIKENNDIIGCSNLLYSFAERAQEAEIYSLLFENLVENILYNTEADESDNELKTQEHALDDMVNNLFSDTKLFDFSFDEDFWKRLDFNNDVYP